MEYLAGSLLTFVIMYFFSRAVNQPKNDVISLKISYNQSKQYEMIKHYIPFSDTPLDTQASKHFLSKYRKIIFYNNLAYWIEDNAVYSAEYNENEILFESKKTIDMMTIDGVELDKMIFIVDKLTEGNENDSRNSGK